MNNIINRKKFLNFTELSKFQLDKYASNAKNYYMNNYKINKILRNFIKIISDDK